MKKILSVLIVILLLSFSVTKVLAQEIDKIDYNLTKVNSSTTEVSEIFSDFIHQFFNPIHEMRVSDSNGIDITEEFLVHATPLYTHKNFIDIQDLIIQQNLFLSYKVKQSSLNLNDESVIIDSSSIIPMAFRTEVVKEYFYKIKTETTLNTYRKEWTTSLIGTFTYDPNTYRIVSANAPTFRLETANFGALFTPYVNNINTGRTILDTKVKFYDTYTMHSKFSPLGLPSITLNFGLMDDNFYGIPSF